MLRILGPTYQYQGESINDEVIYIDDHCYDEETKTYPIKQLLDNNPGPRMLVFDHLGHDDELSAWPHVCFPVCLAVETTKFAKQMINPNWNNKTHCFNFMINKPRSGRLHFLELVDKLDLTSFCHTLPWKQSPFKNIEVTNYKFGPETVLDRGIKNGSFSNAETYQQLLKSTVFEPTCVSLITEPCYIEREVLITEKTLMAIWGGTIPIWAGGWRLPDVMRDLGFDVFDDIVDHSYSTLPNPRQRLEQAVFRNLRLLQDCEYAMQTVDKNQHRLKHNLSLIRERNVFAEMVTASIDHDSRLIDVAKLWGFQSTKVN